jgi:hypothetical protein
MTSKTKALHTAGESDRARKVRERNENSRNEGIKMVARERHERRHGGKKGSSKAEHLASMKDVSKDYGSNIHKNRHMPHASL